MKFKLQPYSIHELGQRENQEDSMFPDYGQSKPEDRLFILCDGMGGHEKGEVASATVCEAMSSTILSRWNPSEPLSDELLQQAIDDAYDALDAKDEGGEKKMGTTMTFVCLHANGVTVAHIGDSRVYQLRPATKKNPARIVNKTQDHSLVNDLIKIGEITEEEAKNHPQKNVITRAMQPHQDRRAKADIEHWNDVQEGDYFYMCSDGMLEQTTDENLLFIITKQGTKDTEKVEMLREVTAENKDNHTAHLIYISKVEGAVVTPVVETASRPVAATPQGTWVTPTYAKPAKKKSVLPAILGVLAILVIAAGAYFFFGNSNGSKDKDKIEYDEPSRMQSTEPARDASMPKERVIIETEGSAPGAPSQQNNGKPNVKPTEQKEQAATTETKPEAKPEATQKETAKPESKEADKFTKKKPESEKKEEAPAKTPDSKTTQQDA